MQDVRGNTKVKSQKIQQQGEPLEGKTFTEQTRKPRHKQGSIHSRITTDTVPREHPDWLEGHPMGMVARSFLSPSWCSGPDKSLMELEHSPMLSCNSHTPGDGHGPLSLCFLYRPGNVRSTENVLRTRREGHGLWRGLLPANSWGCIAEPLCPADASMIHPRATFTTDFHIRGVWRLLS